MSVRVLILEDDPLIALDLQMIVEGEGHQVVGICGSLAEARRQNAANVDFALLDIDVLDGKSYDFAASLNHRHIPFAFVSGSRRSEVPSHLTHAQFIAKPYGEASIIACLAAANG